MGDGGHVRFAAVSVEQLAVLGGAPSFDAPLHVGRPNEVDRERFLARVNGILDRNWLTNDGPLVRELEAVIAEQAGVAHAVATCNATTALGLLARALDLDGEVIVPSYTFVGTAHAFRWQRLQPVFCDVDPVTHGADPASVAALISDRTAAIIPVHLWGTICDVDALEALAADAGVPLAFDAAHAFGCGRGGRSAGSFGRAEVFSLHATKYVQSFEGGAVTTDDDELAERLRLLRNFGFTGYDRVDHLGTNAKMPEASAAMGLTSIEGRWEVEQRNLANRQAYSEALAEVPGLAVVGTGSNDRHNHQYVVVEVDEASTGLDRDALVAVLWAENVLARRYFAPGCHRMEPYASEGPHPTLPVTERLCDDVLVLPTGTAVTPDDARTIGDVLARAADAADRVAVALAPS